MTTFNHILPVAFDGTGSRSNGKTIHIAHTVYECVVEEYLQGYLEDTSVLNAVRFHRTNVVSSRPLLSVVTTESLLQVFPGG
jgi:hypothetical protein